LMARRVSGSRAAPSSTENKPAGTGIGAASRCVGFVEYWDATIVVPVS
jgi:hypothetical protein